jgi:hyperosmotically inducible protein
MHTHRGRSGFGDIDPGIAPVESARDDGTEMSALFRLAGRLVRGGVMRILLTMILAASFLLAASTADDKIESSFKNSYVSKTYLKDDSVKIEAKDGIVTLTGTVSEESHKSLAGETAAGLPSVTRVDNRLEVLAGHSGNNSMANSNEWITAKVKAALLFHSKVSATTGVAVNGGVVTLSGTADSAEQKNLTAECARGVDGVTDVKNNMVVSTEPSTVAKDRDKAITNIDDASITAQVKMALLLDKSTSSLKTAVQTTDGIVTLTGQATTKAARDSATKLVSDVNGVKGVVNHMTI